MDLMRWTLWELPYGLEKVNPMEVTWNEWKWKSLSKWMESMRFEWIEVNRTIWSEMSDLKDLTLWTLWQSPYELRESVPIKMTWVISMGISLWVENECPYQNDLSDPYENVPIKMIRIDEIWMNWSE